MPHTASMLATPDAMRVASQPIGAGEHSAATATSAVSMAVESAPVERETTAALNAPILTIEPEAPKRASASQTPVPVPATKRANVRQPPVPVPVTKPAGARQTLPAGRTPAGAIPPAARTPAVSRVRAPDAETRKARQPDRWQAMHVSLARCGGDLIDRFVCDQRVRHTSATAIGAKRRNAGAASPMIAGSDLDWRIHDWMPSTKA